MGVESACPYAPFRRVARWLLILLTVLGLARFGFALRRELGISSQSPDYYDFRVMMVLLNEYKKTGSLYNTSYPGAYDPKTIVMFKYPPPHAALLLSMVDPEDKTKNVVSVPGESRRARSMQAARLLRRQAMPVLTLGIASVVLAALLIVRGLVATPMRRLAMVAVIANWQPVIESLNGPQLEPLILALVAGAALLWRRRLPFLAGALIGIAGAIKVYPWFLLAPGARRRAWTGLLGGAVGAALTLLSSATIVPLRFTREYFLDVMPRLGGVSIDAENVGMPGVLMRTSFKLLGVPAPSTVRLLSAPGAAGQGANAPVWIGLALLLVLIGWMGSRTWRACASIKGVPTPRQEVLLVSTAVCALLAVLPSSWVNYQILLIVPLAICFGSAGPILRDRWTWILMGFMAVSGGIYASAFSIPVVFIRSLLPLAGWEASLRLLRLDPTRPEAVRGQ